MTWTVIVPVKAAADRKRRLGALPAETRARIGGAMLAHVLATAAAHPRVAAVILLAPPEVPVPPGIVGRPDRGRGLNEELEAARAALAASDCLILFADLPHVAAEDLTALFAAAERHGVAVAPDRHGAGTNAVALKAGASFALCFGPGSLTRHAAMVPDPGAIVTRPGLAQDIDTIEDVRVAGLDP